MSQDKPVLTTQQIDDFEHELEKCVVAYRGITHEVCALAKSALDRQGWISLPREKLISYGLAMNLLETMLTKSLSVAAAVNAKRMHDEIGHMLAAAPQNEPPQALPGLDPLTAKEPRAVPFEAGPASGSPDSSALVGRLKEAGTTGLDMSPGDPLCREAAQALRALEVERDEAKKYWTLWYDKCIESDAQRIALQRQLDQHKDWLREALDIGSNAPSGWRRIAAIRKEVFGLPWCTCPTGRCTPDDAVKRCANIRRVHQT